MSIEQIKKINKTIVHEDGRIDSFEKQLINLISGLYDTRFPMIVSENSRCLDFISKNSSNPLVINVSTVIKIREKHDIGYAFVSECEEMIEKSIFAFDSLNKSTSKILVLNKKDEENNPIIAVIRFNKEMGRNAIKINEITSIYDKQRLSNLIIRSYDADKMFYKNKIEQLRSIGLQLPQDVKFALSGNYNKAIFSKSQVERDYQLYLYSKYSVSSEHRLPHLKEDVPSEILAYLSKSSDLIIRYQVAKHGNTDIDTLNVLKNDKTDVISRYVNNRLSSIDIRKQKKKALSKN